MQDLNALLLFLFVFQYMLQRKASTGLFFFFFSCRRKEPNRRSKESVKVSDKTKVSAERSPAGAFALCRK